MVFLFLFVLKKDFTGTKPAELKLVDWLSQLTEPVDVSESWLDQGNYLPFNVSYQLLAGMPATKRRFLAIGLASVKRKKGSYLLTTLNSIFSQSTSVERATMVVVVLLADTDPAWREETVGQITAAHPSQLEQGQLLVIHVPSQFYPPLTDLKRNYNDAPDRVTFRSKQNVDYSFLMNYAGGQGHYYLQLEDDITSAENFVTTIGKNIQGRKAASWVTLEFSTLGYIGKLYKAEHLPLLARFLFLFYQEMPCDWLLGHFRTLLVQKDPIVIKPSLFQHMGTFSSFKGNVNKLKDKFFEKEVYSNPPADVYSDISVYKAYVPRLAWEAGEGFFWGRTPGPGNYLTVVLRAPAVVTSVKVETGQEGKDLLESGVVELGQNVEQTAKGEKSCKDFTTLGEVKNGVFAKQDLEAAFGSSSSCLRLRVTGTHKDWITVMKIRVTVKT